MTDRENSTTRRAVIAGLLAAPAATALVALPARAASSGSLSAKIAANREAWRIRAEYSAKVEAPLQARCHAAKSAWKAACDAIPHYTTRATYEAVGDGSGPKQVAMSTSGHHVAVARSMLSSVSHDEHLDDYYTACAELIELDGKREAERQRLHEKHGLAALDAEWEKVQAEMSRLAEIGHAAEQRVIEHPASSLAELAEKIAFAKAEFIDAEDVLPAILADVRRLQKRGGN